MLPVLTSIISISVRPTCVPAFGCLNLARAGPTTSPIANRSAPGSNRQSKLQFAQPPTFHTSGHAVHPVRKLVELRLVGGWCVGISGGAPRRWPSSTSHTPPDAFGRGRFCRSKPVQKAVSASGDFQWELGPGFTQDCAAIDSRCPERTKEATGQASRIDNAFDGTRTIECV